MVVPSTQKFRFQKRQKEATITNPLFFFVFLAIFFFQGEWPAGVLLSLILLNIRNLKFHSLPLNFTFHLFIHCLIILPLNLKFWYLICSRTVTSESSFSFQSAYKLTEGSIFSIDKPYFLWWIYHPLYNLAHYIVRSLSGVEIYLFFML